MQDIEFSYAPHRTLSELNVRLTLERLGGYTERHGL